MEAWRIEVAYRPDLLDPAGEAARNLLLQAGLAGLGPVRSRRGTLLPGSLAHDEAVRAGAELLADPVTETFTVLEPGASPPPEPGLRLTILRKPGVMDPVAHSTTRALAELGLPVAATGTYRSFLIQGPRREAELLTKARKVLANEVIEEVLVGRVPDRLPGTGSPASPARREVAIRALGRLELAELSRAGCLSLSLEELLAIQAHFRSAGREPTDVELETLAQTWSEHCKHKTLTGRISYRGRIYDNLLRSCIAAVTRDLDREWCLSVFRDNAGVIAFTEEQCLCVKVETHNHPSAIEPFGGAGTGIGGVVRDIMGTGLGARPIASLDVFCLAPLDLPEAALPAGALHPRRILEGIVAGVRDYGNPMGIPTVNGSLCFDPDFAGNPLVYVGSVGLLPRSAVTKEVRAGDIVVLAGGRTGRDGIHGATFSSVELTHESEATSGGAVQIGDPITEKKLLEGQLRARDRGLYRAVTDCGAGGLSSAVGEMGEELGAEVDLARVPLKYAGLAPWEIWVSEAQERMVLAVPPERLEELLELFAAEEVEATPIGTFGGGRLVLRHGTLLVADLELEFLHRGVPRLELEAAPPPRPTRPAVLPPAAGLALAAALEAVLAHPNVASKEWVIRQYDHEVQAGGAGGPLAGPAGAGPADAARVAPLLGDPRGFALGHGLQVRIGRVDPAAAAALAVDEALRNVVAAGADPDRVCLLDNYCFGNPRNPEVLGAIVEATLGACEAARTFRAPFVSGKDSLNNEFRTRDGEPRSIPGSLLITALGMVPDVRRAPGTDFLRPGAALWLLGRTAPELGGSVYLATLGQLGDTAPRPDAAGSLAIMRALHQAIQAGLIESAHDLSEGGLGAALAESAFGRGLGAAVDLTLVPRSRDTTRADELLFSESPGRFLVSLRPGAEPACAALFAGLPAAQVGQTLAEPVVRIQGLDRAAALEAPLQALSRAWRSTLDLGRH